jgi:hypothetical protein
LIHFDGVEVATIWQGTLATEEELILKQDGSWAVYDAIGLEKVYNMIGATALLGYKGLQAQ